MWRLLGLYVWILKHHFRDLVDLRAKRCVRDAASPLQTEIMGMGSKLLGGRFAFVIMMLSPVIRQQVDSLTLHIVQSGLHSGVNEAELYSFFEVLFMSNITNPSMSATRALFLEMGYNHVRSPYAFRPLRSYVGFILLCDMLRSGPVGLNGMPVGTRHTASRTLSAIHMPLGSGCFMF